MNLLVGYQLCARPIFLQTILQHRAEISEVYFSWGSQPSGRSAAGAARHLVAWEAEAQQRTELQQIADSGIGLNLLLNANCYGARSLSRAFYQEIGDLADYLQSTMNLVSVTTTSPIIARFLKDNFPELEIKASVNMEIGTIAGMEYVADCFDGFYLKRELNRSPKAIRPLRQWCLDHGKKLYLLANSGCLNHCSAHVFHDNLVAHEQEIAQMDNAFTFQGVCRSFLASPERQREILQYSNWIRPEDLDLYEDLVDGVKLATRISPQPTEILLAYCRRAYNGNILELMEPNFAGLFYPQVLNAHNFPEDYIQKRYDCSGCCSTCGYCKSLFQQTVERLGDIRVEDNDLGC